MKESGLEKKKEDLVEEKKTIEDQLKKEDLDKDTKASLQSRLTEVDTLLEDIPVGAVAAVAVAGGCFPGSAMFVDKRGQQRSISSMHIGDEVQVIINGEIQLEPVITFIHCQPEVMQEYLKITTEKGNILKITEDHLLFVEKMGQATAIPARDVEAGDTLYVRGDHNVETDAVKSISIVHEKGVYAPVTLSGTILVNDVHHLVLL
ncbi:hypothetical protein OS493_003386 [Desmophyllum pertusum]|uniref:Hint domain-containing protein n=1 Tax=Desmophyllum pertusum TaxID=174260 RepID=A0A9X0A5F3_9CNID|nr:hypothetical protein OS493_003386 [Desmophyllum pertusum]